MVDARSDRPILVAPLTPWAEYLRGMNVRTTDEAREIILVPWAAELQLPDDTIKLTFDSAAGHGRAPPALAHGRTEVRAAASDEADLDLLMRLGIDDDGLAADRVRSVR